MNNSNKNHLEKILTNNIYIQNINKMLDFVLLINKLYKHISKKQKFNTIEEIKFNNMILYIECIENLTFNFKIKIYDNKLNYNSLLSNFYDILYLFFINFNILNIATSDLDMNKKSDSYKTIDIKIEFEFSESDIIDIYNYSIKEIIKILNLIERKKNIRLKRKLEKEKEQSINQKGENKINGK